MKIFWILWICTLSSAFSVPIAQAQVEIKFEDIVKEIFKDIPLGLINEPSNSSNNNSSLEEEFEVSSENILTTTTVGVSVVNEDESDDAKSEEVVSEVVDDSSQLNLISVTTDDLGDVTISDYASDVVVTEAPEEHFLSRAKVVTEKAAVTSTTPTTKRRIWSFSRRSRFRTSSTILPSTTSTTTSTSSTNTTASTTTSSSTTTTMTTTTTTSTSTTTTTTASTTTTTAITPSETDPTYSNVKFEKSLTLMETTMSLLSTLQTKDEITETPTVPSPQTTEKASVFEMSTPRLESVNQDETSLNNNEGVMDFGAEQYNDVTTQSGAQDHATERLLQREAAAVKTLQHMQHSSQSELSSKMSKDNNHLAEKTIVYQVDDSINVIYVIIATVPCILLLLLIVAWLCLKRRSKVRSSHGSKDYVVVPKEDADTTLMTNMTSSATLRTIPDLIPTSARNSAVFLIPGHSMPNINKYDLRDDGSSYHGNSLLNLSSNGNSPKHDNIDLESNRKRWQSDGKEVDMCPDGLQEGGRWKSEDWEKDQSFMISLAKRLENVDSKAEITEL